LFDEAGNLRRRLAAGEAADVVVLPRPVLNQLQGTGKIAPVTIVDLSRSEMGAGVRIDRPKPDLTTADGLKRALLDAKKIVITDPASGGVSGVHMADVFQRLGIADELKPKLILNTGGYNAEFVARGDADIAFQLANEVRAVPGVEFIRLPAEFARDFVFSGAVTSGTKDGAAAKAVLDVLAGPAGAAAIRAKRLEPLAGK
jgi:molybdate transport system substrate-binding protein